MENFKKGDVLMIVARKNFNGDSQNFSRNLRLGELAIAAGDQWRYTGLSPTGPYPYKYGVRVISAKRELKYTHPVENFVKIGRL